MTANNPLTDKDIALDLLLTSKSTMVALSKALLETTNAEIRKVLMIQLLSYINWHHDLSDLSISKGWYDAYSEANKQLQNELGGIGPLLQN